MRLLIIGASGFIGRHIFKYADSLGYQVIGTSYSRPEAGFSRFNMLTDDIEDIVSKEYFNDEQVVVIICSAITKIDRCCEHKDDSYKLNVEKTINLIERLNVLGAKVVFLSSEAVFDGTQGYYNEFIPPSPLNEYGRQKVAVENFILSNFPSNIVIRLSIVVGDTPVGPHLFSDWYSQVIQNKPILCISNQIFSPTFVADVAKGVIRALEENVSGLFHLTNSEFFVREELARQFLIILHKKVDIISMPADKFHFLEKRALKTYLDGSRFQKAVDFRFTTIREVLESFARNIN